MLVIFIFYFLCVRCDYTTDSLVASQREKFSLSAAATIGRQTKGRQTFKKLQGVRCELKKV